MKTIHSSLVFIESCKDKLQIKIFFNKSIRSFIKITSMLHLILYFIVEKSK